MPFFGVPIRNGLPIGLGSVAGFGVQQFDPSQLFEGGTVAGAWYDPSDLSTMFDTSVGTTPMAMPGQGSAVSVGLMLDKSQGLVLSANDITGFTPALNGTATAATYNSTTGAGTAARTNSSNISYLIKTGLTGNRVYKITVTNTGSSNLQVRQNGYSVGLFTVVPGATVSGLVTTYTHTDVSIVPSVDGTTIAFTIVSFQQMAGNHAVSIAPGSSTSRPELRARVNLLTYSEEFDNGAWSKLNFLAFGSGSVVNATTAPNGTITADLLVPNTTAAAEHYVDVGPSTVVVSGTTYTLSWSAKAAGYKWLRLAFNSAIAPANERAAWFDVETGAVGTVQSNVTASIQSQGDGWYRCSISRSVTTSTTTTFGFASITNADQGLGFTANGTSGMYWWGADLRPANIGANVPAYQRIADADTYDTNGFPLYLRFDGLDDGMYTPANLNLSATDKVGVFAGVRKLSDATIGTITELSSNASTTNGTFQLRGPATNGAQNYYATVSGTSVAEYLPATFAAPISNVVSSIMDIAGASISTELIPRVNGIVEQDSPSGSAGTGNFGTYPLYIGSRNNSTFWLNGHLYSLAVVGSAVSAGNIAAMENWVAGKTGIQI